MYYGSIDHMHVCSEMQELESYGNVKLPTKKKKKKKKRREPASSGHQWTSIVGHCRFSSSNQNRGVAALKHDHCWQDSTAGISHLICL